MTKCACIGCRSVSIHHDRVPCLRQPVEGSIQWAMDRGTLFQVNGVYKYGQLMTRAEEYSEAANLALFKGDLYSAWVPPGTVLTVWNVYAGSIGGFCMKDPRRFVVHSGEAVPEVQS